MGIKKLGLTLAALGGVPIFGSRRWFFEFTPPQTSIFQRGLSRRRVFRRDGGIVSTPEQYCPVGSRGIQILGEVQPSNPPAISTLAKNKAKDLRLTANDLDLNTTAKNVSLKSKDLNHFSKIFEFWSYCHTKSLIKFIRHIYI